MVRKRKGGKKGHTCSKCRKNKRRNARMSSVSGGNFFDSIDLEKLGKQAIGFAGGKMINPALTKIPFIEKGLAGDKAKWYRAGIGAGKVAAAIAIDRYFGEESDFVQDAAFGFALEGGLEMISGIFPGLNLGIGYADDVEYLGEAIEVNLDELSGSGDNRLLDRLNRKELAGSGDHITDQYSDEDVLAGEYAYEMEYA